MLFLSPLPGAIADSNVLPSQFVKPDASAAQGVCGYVPCGAGDRAIGITGDGTQVPPGFIEALGGTISTPYAEATTGKEAVIYTLGDICLLKCGTAAGWTAADLLKPDAGGYGVTATTGNNYSAWALSTVNANESGMVLICFGTV